MGSAKRIFRNKISVHFEMRGRDMRKLFHTAAAVAAPLALSMAANAAEVGARLRFMRLLQSMWLRRLVGLDSTSAPTSVEPGADVT